jgi:hypothetical protein
MAQIRKAWRKASLVLKRSSKWQYQLSHVVTSMYARSVAKAAYLQRNGLALAAACLWQLASIEAMAKA